VRITLAAIEIPTSSADGAGQCNNGRVASGVFIHEHRSSLREFNFENVVLRSGNWDDALAPLTRLSGSERWKQGRRDTDTVNVPIVLSPAGVSQKQLQKAICALQQQKGPRTLRSLAKAGSRTRELLWGSPDHMKRLLRSSVLSWR
jgi:hypothetical protein